MEEERTQLQKIILGKRWILFIVLIPLLLIVWMVLFAYRPLAFIPGNSLLIPSLPPKTSASPTATPTVLVTSTRQPTATQPTLPTATGTREPTASQTITAFPILETTVKVSRGGVYLRSGPGTYYTVVRKLQIGDQLILLGRLSNDTWLFTKTSDGREGWVITKLVSISGVNLDDHPIQTPAPPTEATVKVNGNYVNLRTGPGTNYSKVQQVNYGDLLILLGRSSDSSWYYVKTSGGKDGWIKKEWLDLGRINLDIDYLPFPGSPPTETSTPVVLTDIDDHWIDIDLSEQKLYAYDGADLIASFLVSTGLDLYPTEIGKYHVYAKFLFTDMRGDGYFLPDVPFTMYYSGDFSIHGTYWHHSFGTPMSHGCVNMDTREAELIYNWATIGTIVNIHR